jgi:hypothetical protein
MHRRAVQALLEMSPGRDPLHLLVEWANDGALPMGLRVQAAIGATPYLHPKLSAIQHSSAPTPPSTKAVDQLRELLARRDSEPPLIEHERQAPLAPAEPVEERPEAEIIALKTAK